MDILIFNLEKKSFKLYRMKYLAGNVLLNFFSERNVSLKKCRAFLMIHFTSLSLILTMDISLMKV